MPVEFPLLHPYSTRSILFLRLFLFHPYLISSSVIPPLPSPIFITFLHSVSSFLLILLLPPPPLPPAPSSSSLPLNPFFFLLHSPLPILPLLNNLSLTPLLLCFFRSYPPPLPSDPPTALPLTAATPTSGCSLYVSNLPPDVDDTSLWRLFCPFGSVHGVRVIRHLATNKCKGSALVTMSTYDEAMVAAAYLTGHQVDGQPIQVSIIVRKAPPTPCVTPAGFFPATPSAGYGLLPVVGPTDHGAPLEVVRVGNGGLQFVGYQGYQGLPGAVAMATVADCGGLTIV